MPGKISILCPICGRDSTIKTVYNNVYDNKKLLKCLDCGLFFVWPVPLEKELGDIYTKEYYNAWSIDSLGAEGLSKMKRFTFGAILDIIARFKHPGAILDIGCAFGDFLNVAREREWDVYGVEFSPYAAQEARRKLGGDKVFQGDFTDVCLPRQNFDVIAMIDVLEHGYAPAVFLERVYGLLNPGGIVVILTPDIGSPSRKIMQKLWPHFNREHLVY